jgi:histone acetyltransferase (RNA polymerase elongator complex component)
MARTRPAEPAGAGRAIALTPVIEKERHFFKWLRRKNMAPSPLKAHLRQNVISTDGLRGRFFRHPEPARPRSRVWPVYLSFQGCPGRCVFCAQTLQSAAPPAPLADILAAMEQGLEAARREGRGPYELAFYGGVFTALPAPWPERFLQAAVRARRAGIVSRIRCSTRPDACAPGLLAQLAGCGLDLVEIGAQTFDEAVLAASGRGHDAKAVGRAARAVREAGLELGLQLLPGLPGHTPAAFARDVAETCALAPSLARLHPCLVVEGTPLAGLYRAGRYAPWPLETTMAALAEALPPLWRAGVRVARIGLAPEPGLEAAILAGPRHPALGARVRARALCSLVSEEIAALGGPPAGLEAPRRFAGELFGHAGELAGAYAALGLPRTAVRFVDGDDFFLAAKAV